MSAAPQSQNSLQKDRTHKVALITGISGQDGYFLKRLLLDKGYRVVGTIRRTSVSTENELEQREDRVKLYYSDLTDIHSMIRIVQKEEPDEIYNLGAQSHVQVSFDIPEYTANVVALGTLRLLEAVRVCGLEKKIKFFQAFTSDIFETPTKQQLELEREQAAFGEMVRLITQSEKSKMHPRSPYGCAKLFSYWIVKNYREGYGMYACSAILFNHESSRRGDQFVTRKITRAVARIKYDLQDHVELGNLDAMRDWGHAKDFVNGMWLMLQHGAADDYCLATGQVQTVRDFCQHAFERAGLRIEWRGKRGTVEEHAVNLDSGKTVVKVNPAFFRPIEQTVMCGDSTKAEQVLGWKREFSFGDLVGEMVDYDLQQIERELKVRHGRVLLPPHVAANLGIPQPTATPMTPTAEPGAQPADGTGIPPKQ